MTLHRWGAALAILGTFACTSRIDARLDITTDAHTPQPTFRITTTLATRKVRVERVELGPDDIQRAPLWQLLAEPGTQPAAPRLLTYGQIPPGFFQAAPPAVLFPGEYALVVDFATGSRSLAFVVASDGSVTAPGLQRIAPAR